MAKLIIGCGYLGLRVARRWFDHGEIVFAVTRSKRRAGEFRRLGLWPLVADICHEDSMTYSECVPAEDGLELRSMDGLPEAETVLYAVGYDAGGEATRRQVYIEGLRNVLRRLPPSIDKFIYISTTGVYGQSSGEWIDESTPPSPGYEAARLFLEAEDVLRDSPVADRTVILRLAGIYGPGRVPRQDALTSGEKITCPRKGWLNLVHVEDAASAVLAAEQLAEPPRMYLISDGNPVERREFYREACRVADAPPPNFVEPTVEAACVGRGSSSRRVSNARMLAELGFELRFPDFRSGLADALGSA